jgi:hypothetical protein
VTTNATGVGPATRRAGRSVRGQSASRRTRRHAGRGASQTPSGALGLIASIGGSGCPPAAARSPTARLLLWCLQHPGTCEHGTLRAWWSAVVVAVRAIRAFQGWYGRGGAWPSWRERRSRHRGLLRLTIAARLLASGSGLPVGPAQLVEQERREEADEQGRGEQRQEVGHRGDVSELAGRQQADDAGGCGGERADDADRQQCGRAEPRGEPRLAR